MKPLFNVLLHRNTTTGFWVVGLCLDKCFLTEMMKLEFLNWGLVEYEDATRRQTALFDERVRARQNALPAADLILFCEHPPVYTLGKSGLEENLLVSNQMLREKGVSFYRTNRGGDITFHGPGQIVCYPVLNLEHFKIGLKEYLFRLEEVVIEFLSHYSIKGDRLEGATGVWLDVQNPAKVRKICAMGIKSSHFITMHGFALNIQTDLSYFNLINPCGFANKGVTSLEKETGYAPDINQCISILERCIRKQFQYPMSY